MKVHTSGIVVTTLFSVADVPAASIVITVVVTVVHLSKLSYVIVNAAKVDGIQSNERARCLLSLVFIKRIHYFFITYFCNMFILFLTSLSRFPTHSPSLPHSFLLLPFLPTPSPLPSPQRTWPETSFITSFPPGVRRPSYLRDFILSLFSSSFTLRSFLFFLSL